MKRIKVIQIGIAHDHASAAIGSLRRQSDIFELVGYVALEGEKSNFPDAYKGLKRLTLNEAFAIPELKAAVIETRELDLAKYAILAAERGLAVHMDKPGGTNPLEFKRLISIFGEKNSVLSIGYMYRYNPAVIELLEDIKSGKLGEIYCVEAHMDCMHTPEKRQWLSQFKGGQMFYLGCHLIDLIYQIMGEPEQVIPLNCSTGADGVAAEDYGMAVLKYKNGISFAKSCAIEPGGFMRRQLVVCGSKGTAQLCPFEVHTGSDNLYTDVRKVYNNIFDWSCDGERYRTEKYNRYDAMFRAFWEFAVEKRKNPYTLEYEERLYELVLKSCGVEIGE